MGKSDPNFWVLVSEAYSNLYCLALFRSQTLSFLVSLESGKGLPETCCNFVKTSASCLWGFPFSLHLSHLPTVTHWPGALTIHPTSTIPAQLTPLPGSSPTLTPALRIERGKREKRERRQGRAIYHIIFGNSGAFCVWLVMFVSLCWRRFGQGFSLSSLSISPSTLPARSNTNSRWHPASRETSKAFQFTELLNELQLNPYQRGSRQSPGEDPEQSNLKRQCY